MDVVFQVKLAHVLKVSVLKVNNLMVKQSQEFVILMKTINSVTN